MSTEENKDLVRRLVDAINNQSLDEPDILLDPDFRLNGEPVPSASPTSRSSSSGTPRCSRSSIYQSKT